MKFIHDDGGNDVDDGDANHDVGYDVIDDVNNRVDDANNHVADDVGNGVGCCHPWHDHPIFPMFLDFYSYILKNKIK